MTHLVLTLNNYLTSPVEYFLLKVKSIAGRVYEALIQAQTKRALVAVRQELAKHRMYKETYDQLWRLRDSELKDIGISRGEIHEIALQAFIDEKNR